MANGRGVQSESNGRRFSPGVRVARLFIWLAFPALIASLAGPLPGHDSAERARARGRVYLDRVELPHDQGIDNPHSHVAGAPGDHTTAVATHSASASGSGVAAASLPAAERATAVGGTPATPAPAGVETRPEEIAAAPPTDPPRAWLMHALHPPGVHRRQRSGRRPAVPGIPAIGTGVQLL